MKDISLTVPIMFGGKVPPDRDADAREAPFARSPVVGGPEAPGGDICAAIDPQFAIISIANIAGNNLLTS